MQDSLRLNSLPVTNKPQLSKHSRNDHSNEGRWQRINIFDLPSLYSVCRQGCRSWGKRGLEGKSRAVVYIGINNIRTTYRSKLRLIWIRQLANVLLRNEPVSSAFSTWLPIRTSMYSELLQEYHNLASVLWHCWLGDRNNIRPVKKLGVGLLVVTFWLELCTSYSSNCHYHLHHPYLR